jgi:multidrug efflux pump subunit AcrB
MARVLANSKGILLLVSALCLAGGYSAVTMPSAVFPHTDFPRVVILIDSGAMPADEMMATITRPVEEAMKDIPGTVNIRSSTSRGSAVVNVFFDWKTDMIQSELYVLGRVSQIRNALPAHAQIRVYRLTFSAFPALGISLTSAQRNITDLWETARYDILPRFLRIRGVARVNLVGGRVPEWHVVVDPQKLEAHRLTLDQICKALAATNQITPVGMHEENHQLYLAIVNNRLQDASEIEDVVVAWVNQAPVRVRDVGLVRRGSAVQPCDGGRAGRRAAERVRPAGLQRRANRSRPAKGTRAAARRPATRHEAGVLLRPIAVRARRARQRLGEHHLRPNTVGARAVRVPAECVGDAGGCVGHSDYGAADARWSAAGGHEF